MKSKKILLILFISIIVIICSCLIFLTSPYGQCIDFLSGYVPESARDQLISRFVKAAINQDEETLLATSNEPVAAMMLELQPELSEQYTVTYIDNLAGLYEYRIKFNSGLELYVNIYGTWPTCPDFNVTEDEIIQNISVNSVQNITEP
ncbi:MAG: hypothetical protein DWQ04_03995 [Chloroflexi bacterium]|nr:MAG: hypothetical protein DWQ04_03995 [Chloroflexota bacterium]